MKINPYSLTKIILVFLAISSLVGAFAYRIYMKLTRSDISKLMDIAGMVLIWFFVLVLFVVVMAWLDHKARRYDEGH